MISSLLLGVLAAAAAASPPARLINLPRHTQRFEEVKRQLDLANIHFERVQAVDGRAMSVSDRQLNVTALGRLLLTPGMVGCFLSHRRCWQECLDGADEAFVDAAATWVGAAAEVGEGDAAEEAKDTAASPERGATSAVEAAAAEAAAVVEAGGVEAAEATAAVAVERGSDGAMLIFEDDVVLEAEFGQRLEMALAQLRAADPEWDVLLLGAIGCVHPEGATNLPQTLSYVHGLIAGGTRRRRRLTADGTVHVPFRPFGTHAYLISRSGAAKLLAQCPKANFHVDVVAWGQPTLRLYAIHPLLAKQTHADTTIGGLSHHRLPPLFACALESTDAYTGVRVSWAWTAPLMLLGGSRWGLLLTSGRAVTSCLTLIALALTFRSRNWLMVLAALYPTALFLLLRLLSLPGWPRP